MRGEGTSRSGTTLCQGLIFLYSVAAWIPTAVGEVLRGTPHVLCGTTQTRNPSPRVEEQLDYFQLGVNQFLVWQWKSVVTKKKTHLLLSTSCGFGSTHSHRAILQSWDKPIPYFFFFFSTHSEHHSLFWWGRFGFLILKKDNASDNAGLLGKL